MSVDRLVAQLDNLSDRANRVLDEREDIDQKIWEARRKRDGHVAVEKKCPTCKRSHYAEPSKISAREYDNLSDEIADLEDAYNGADDDLDEIRELTEDLLADLLEETVFEVSIELC
ncbi:MAG: hypothetical protein ACW99G_05010 [Candidatus Thorarchaeota archaeon]|jgi:DNA repair exonuclease SbcCD ATPase subunit